MKVFLGGTCAGRKWRDEITPKLICDYYNPIVKNWSEEDRLREVRERQTADIVVYTITSDMAGVYSIAEIIDDSNKRPHKTVLCILYDGFNKKMAHSLRAVANLARENGAYVVESLDELVTYLNLRASITDLKGW